MNGGLQNAGVAKHGQRRKIQSLVLQRSASSNLVPCIFYIFIYINHASFLFSPEIFFR